MVERWNGARNGAGEVAQLRIAQSTCEFPILFSAPKPSAKWQARHAIWFFCKKLENKNAQ
jgi:hypothetical protein